MSEEPDYHLVMPFVTVASKGGPHDDESFCIGYLCGQWDERLAMAHRVSYEATVQTTALPQLDLIGMRHGYTMKSTETEAEGWSNVLFTVGAP